MAYRGIIELGSFAWPNHATPASSDDLPPLPPTNAVLRFALPRAEQAAVIVHDAQGHLMRTLLAGHLSAGEHACGWDGLDDWQTPVPAGQYTLRLEVEDQLVTARRVSVDDRR